MDKKSKMVQSQSMLVLNQLLEFAEARIGIKSQLNLQPGFSGSISLNVEGQEVWRSTFADMPDALRLTRSYLESFVSQQVEGLNEKVALKMAEVQKTESERSEWVELAEQVQKGDFETEGKQLSPPIKDEIERKQMDELQQLIESIKQHNAQIYPINTPSPIKPMGGQIPFDWSVDYHTVRNANHS